MKMSVQSTKGAEINDWTKGVVILDIEEDVVEQEVVDILQKALSTDKANIKTNPMEK